jgi:hypothetical protein
MPAPQPRDAKGRFLPYPKWPVGWSRYDVAVMVVTAAVYGALMSLPLWVAVYGGR